MEINVIASGSSGNATMISDGATALLLDCGIPVRALEIGTGFRLSGLSGCLVTHEHADHSKACKGLAKRGITIYSGFCTFAALGLAGHRYKAVRALEPFSVGTFRVLPFDVVHDAAEPLGYLLESGGEKLVYFVDTAYVKYSFTGLTHIIAECNHGTQELLESVHNGVIAPELARRITQNHLSLERLLDFLKKCDTSRLREVHLVHLSDNNSSERRFLQEVRKATGAEVYTH